MRYAVTCLSQTGNTRKVAQAIASALPGDVAVTGLEHAVPDDADVVFVGMPVLQFGAPAEAGAFLQSRCAGRRVALFVTHAADEHMPELRPWLQECRDAASGCDVIGFFHCQGSWPNRSSSTCCRRTCPIWCGSPRWPAWPMGSRTQAALPPRRDSRARSLAMPATPPRPHLSLRSSDVRQPEEASWTSTPIPTQLPQAA